jgi:hypothetical protein
MKNIDHAAKHDVDPTYLFSEEIDIGIVCGPDVFKKSCIGFYDDPNMEWLRQWESIKDYVNYIMTCVYNKDTWEILPEDFRKKIDAYIDAGPSNDADSRDWWRVRDSKRRYLLTKRPNKKKLAHPYALNINLGYLLRLVQRLNVVPNLASFMVGSDHVCRTTSENGVSTIRSNITG